jgi:hypothetical protein
MGLHLCYGNPGGKHVIEPADTGLMTEFANAIFAVVRRPITWLHMPVPKNRDDDAYFAPLAGLRLPAGTEFYLGLVHLSDGLEGTRRRMEAAKRHAPPFGVGWECGLRAFPVETIPHMLALHKAAADLLSVRGTAHNRITRARRGAARSRSRAAEQRHLRRL